MGETFEKRRYRTAFGFQLSHTQGIISSSSTVSRPHTTANYMVFYFLHGHGNIRVEGKTYEMNAGDVVFISPPELFCCTVDRDHFHERMVLYLPPSIIERLPGDYSFLWDPFTRHEKGVGNHIPAETVRVYGLDALFAEMHEQVMRGDPTGELLAFGKVVELLTVLERCTDDSATRPHRSSLIDDVLAYLNENYTQPLTVAEVANQFFVNPSHLAHLFKECTGMPLWTYVILRRIQRFNELLQQGCAAEEASRRVGFQNYSNFFRLYKKYERMTPAEYKKQLRSHGLTK